MAIERIFASMDIGATGLSAQRVRMEVIAGNLANAETTKTPQGGPYRRRMVVLRSVPPKVQFRTVLRGSIVALRTSEPGHIVPEWEREPVSGYGRGVKVANIAQDPSPFRRVYDPSHPDADEDGYVLMPNIRVLKEMVDMLAAQRAYEANAAVVQAEKEMARKALEL
ncbi:MAG: flagellar basal body rod protein FlgC [Candidatus Latescibacterota bacterium]|nr:MAG: flagellar basal body rod protein FlgC [Candidatus Latescibacterota bacterium]